MSLTSYRAAPPRGGPRSAARVLMIRGWFGCVRDWELGDGLAGPGGDLLFRALWRSTIGAGGFHGRVRDGIGCFAPRYGHQAGRARAVIGVGDRVLVSVFLWPAGGRVWPLHA